MLHALGSARECQGIDPHTPKVSQPHFEASVRMKLALPKVGTWSPSGLLKLQSSIVGVKTPLLDVFFISWERS